MAALLIQDAANVCDTVKLELVCTHSAQERARVYECKPYSHAHISFLMCINTWVFIKA